jgi:hypothetical protein
VIDCMFHIFFTEKRLKSSLYLRECPEENESQSSLLKNCLSGGHFAMARPRRGNAQE